MTIPSQFFHKPGRRCSVSLNADSLAFGILSNHEDRYETSLPFVPTEQRNFFIEDRINKKQTSLKTRDKNAARRIFHARNEAHEQPAINLQIARAYLMASDPLVATRTWQHVMEEICKTKHGSTRVRWQRAIKERAFDQIRSVPLIETQAEQLLHVLEKGTASTNVTCASCTTSAWT